MTSAAFSASAGQSVHSSAHRYTWHRIRINTEEKTKVIAAAWGTEFIQFVAVLAILHHDDLKKRINRIMAFWGV